MSVENDLRDAFRRAVEDVMPQPEPYRRLVGLRRRRNRMRLAVGAPVMVAVAAVAALGAGQLMVSPGGGLVEPAASPTYTRTPVTLIFEGLTSLVSAPGNRLYATVRRCSDHPAASTPTGCRARVLGSDDGGRTWTVRTTAEVSVLFAVNATTLVGLRYHMSPDAAVLPQAVVLSQANVISTDGGRRWYPIVMDTEPVPSLPAGSFVECIPATPAPCRLYAVSPQSHRAAPLAVQPTFPSRSWSYPELFAAGSTTLWTHSASTVAVSRDAGKTWRTTTVDPACTSPDPKLWHSTGATAKLVCRGERMSDVRLYQTDDYGVTWHRVAVPLPPPFVRDDQNVFEGGPSFLADGALIGTLSPGHSGLRLWVLPAGGNTWREIPTQGVPQQAQFLETTPDNGLVVYAGGDDEVYLCKDLVHWYRASLPAR